MRGSNRDKRTRGETEWGQKVEKFYHCQDRCLKTVRIIQNKEKFTVVLPLPCIPEDTKQDEFVKEVQALKSLHHPKLIQLLAMCSRGEPVYIVTELMSKGSLKSYLACESHTQTCLDCTHT